MFRILDVLGMVWFDSCVVSVLAFGEWSGMGCFFLKDYLPVPYFFRQLS